MTFVSIDSVVTVERLRGAEADASAPPDLVVEVPHGADERAHFDAMVDKLDGPLPAGLERLFHSHTSLGAWELGRHGGREVVRRDPRRSALLIRCLLPRTFVDTDLVLDPEAEHAGLPAFIDDARDRQKLQTMRARYIALADAAAHEVLEAGGFLLLPRSYGPRPMGVDALRADAMQALMAAAAPDVWESGPLRPEVDLVCRDPSGQSHAPPGMCDALTAHYAESAIEVVESGAFELRPTSRTAQLAVRGSGRALCLGVRRDMIVDRFRLLEPSWIDHQKIRRIAQPLIDAIVDWFAP